MSPRHLILNLFLPICGIVAVETDDFYSLIDQNSYHDLIRACETELNMSMDTGDKNEIDFETVKDFIDFVILQIEK